MQKLYKLKNFFLIMITISLIDHRVALRAGRKKITQICSVFHTFRPKCLNDTWIDVSETAVIDRQERVA